MPLPSNSYTDYAKKAADKYGVPSSVLFGTIQQESGWNPSAVNHNTNGTQDYGIAQLNTRYYPNAWFMTPEEQIDKAAEILADNYKSTGSWYDAVRAYNAGAKGSKDDPNAGKAHADKVFGYINQWGETVPNGNGVAGTDSSNIFEYYADGLKDLWGMFTGQKEVGKDNPTDNAINTVKNNGLAIGIVILGGALILFAGASTFTRR